MTEINKPVKIDMYTDGSTKGNPGISGYGFHAVDDLNTVYDGYGPVGLYTTNNVAEITAIKRGLEYCYSNLPTVNEINIYSDSEYGINGCNKLKATIANGWKTKSKSGIANLSSWMELAETIKWLEDNNVTLTFQWVKGHSNNQPNIIADRMANLGRLELAKGSQEHVCHVADYDVPNSYGAKADKVSKTKLNPYLVGNKLYALSHKSYINDEIFAYNTLTYVDSKKLAGQNIGKRSSDVLYNVTLTKVNIPEIDNLIIKYNDGFPTVDLPIEIDLTVLNKKDMWEHVHKDLHFSTIIKGLNAVHVNSTILATVIDPPKQVFKLNTIFEFGIALINGFKCNTGVKVETFDITEHFYNPAKVKPEMLKTLVVGLKTMTIPNIVLSEPCTQTPQNILLNLGCDLPLRNAINNIIVNSTNLKIHLVIWEKTINSYHVATIFEDDNNLAVYYTPDSSYRISTRED